MHKKDKKAISALVATVLLILITIAGVAIIWGAVMPMITRITQSGQACTNARLNIETSTGYTCLKTSSGDVSIAIGKGSEQFDLAEIQVIVLDTTGSTKSITLGTGTVFPGVNEEKIYTILKGTNWTGNATEVRVAPVVKVGNTKYPCDVSSKVTLIACSA